MRVFVKLYPLSGGNIAGGLSILDVPFLAVGDVGAIKKHLDEEATEFRMDSVTIKTESLPKGHFGDYDASTPYVVEIQRGTAWDAADSKCIFYGPVKKTSIKYDERTRVTSFTVSSWDRAIAQHGTVQARTRIPARVAETWQRGYESIGAVTDMKVVGVDPSLEATLEPGAVIITEAKVGEESLDFHFTVAGSPVQDGTVEGHPVWAVPVLSGADELLVRGPLRGFKISFYNPPVAGQGVDYSYKAIGLRLDQWESRPEEAIGARVNFALGGASWERRIVDAYVAPQARGDTTGPLGDTFAGWEPPQFVWLVLDEGIQGEISADENLDPFGFSADVEYTIYKSLSVEAGEDATVLSSDAYGAGKGTVEPYAAGDLILGLCQRIPGLQDVIDDAAVVRGTPAEVTRLLAFDEEAIQALGDIQRAADCIAKFEPLAVDGAGGERKAGGARLIRLFVETRAFMTGRSPLAPPHAFGWQGQAVGDKPRVVIVSGSKPINLPAEAGEAMGWHPAGAIESPDSLNNKQGVIEVESKLLPPQLDGSSTFVLPENIPSLAGRAERYYNIYSQYFRKKTATLDAVFDVCPNAPDCNESLLGRRVSDAGVGETGLIIGQEVDYASETTTLTLLVAESYTPPVNAAPRAVLHGGEFLEGAGGVATGFFDASGSYDPNGDPITFVWRKNAVDIAGETGRFLEESVADGDVIEVEVSDGELTGAASTTARVFEPAEIPDSPFSPPTLSVAVDAAQSTLEEKAFNVRAIKRGAVLKVFYELYEGDALIEGDVLSTDATREVYADVAGEGQSIVEAAVTVNRPTPQGDVIPSRQLYLRALDTTNGVESAKQVYVVDVNQAVWVEDAVADPTDLGGQTASIFVRLGRNPAVTGDPEFDLSWTVWDSAGNIVSARSGQLLDNQPADGESMTVNFGPITVEDGETGEIIVRPSIRQGLSKIGIFGAEKKIRLGPRPPDDPTQLFTVLEQLAPSGAVYEVATYVPGPIPAGATILGWLAKHDYQFQEVTMKAVPTPTLDMTFTVSGGGTTKDVTMLSGTGTVTSVLSGAITAESIVTVTSPDTVDENVTHLYITIKVAKG